MIVWTQMLARPHSLRTLVFVTSMVQGALCRHRVFLLLLNSKCQHIYSGKLAPRNNGTLSGKLITFDQSEFIPNPSGSSTFFLIFSTCFFSDFEHSLIDSDSIFNISFPVFFDSDSIFNISFLHGFVSLFQAWVAQAMHTCLNHARDSNFVKCMLRCMAVCKVN